MCGRWHISAVVACAVDESLRAGVGVVARSDGVQGSGEWVAVDGDGGEAVKDEVVADEAPAEYAGCEAADDR